MIVSLVMFAAQAAAPQPAPAAPQPAPAAIPSDIPLAAIGRQAMPARGCAAFLWTVNGARTLVAMAGADPAQIRLAIDGKPGDYARSTQSGPGGFGFAGLTEYRGGDVTATLDMTIVTRGDLSAGATVPEATLRIDRAGRDSVVVPVAGLIGCS